MNTGMNRSSVLSLVHSFGDRYLTWMYNKIAGLENTRVHVLTYRHINEKEFPHSPVTILPPPGSLFSKTQKAALWMAGHKPPFIDVRERGIIKRVAKRENPEVIQAHFLGAARLFMDACMDLTPNYIAWVYGSDIFRVRGQERSWLGDLVSEGALICCTSRALANEVISHGASPDRVRVFHPGLKAPDAPPVRHSGEGALKIMSAGRMIECKDPAGMVEEARMIRDRGLDFTWSHYGDGPLMDAVKEKIKTHGLEDKFLLRGVVTNEEVLDAMRSSDVFVHNALVAADGAREAFGFVLAEAAAQGLPAVAMEVGGIPEIVQDQKTGYLVKEGDLEAVAQKIMELASDPGLRASLGKAAHAYARENFDIKKQNRKLETFYRELAAGGP